MFKLLSVLVLFFIALVEAAPQVPMRSLSGIDGWIMIPEKIINTDIFSDVPATTASECTTAIKNAGRNAGAWDAAAKKCIIAKTRNRPSTMYMDTTFKNGYSVNFSLSGFSANPFGNDSNSQCDVVVKEGHAESKVFCVNFPGNKNAVVLIRNAPVTPFSLSGIDGWIMLPQRMIIGKQILGDAPAKSVRECTTAIEKAGQNAGFWDSTSSKCTIAKTRNRPSTMYLDGKFSNGYSVNFSLSWFTENPETNDTDQRCDILIKEGQENAKVFCVDFPGNKNAVVLVRQK